MGVKIHDTGEKPCSYIEGKTARFRLHHYVPASSNISKERYLRERRAFKLARIKAGYFNQSESAGQFACPDCRKCFSAAVKIDIYKPSKNQRKTLKKNSDITFSIQEPFATREMYDLMMDYLRHRHPASNMMDLNFEQFREKAMSHSSVAVLKFNNQVVGVSWIDSDTEIIVGDYCFYDVDFSQGRGLGTLMDLKILEHATNKGIPFVSLGALNDESPKLKHKGQYAGTHIFNAGKWVPYQRPTQSP